MAEKRKAEEIMEPPRAKKAKGTRCFSIEGDSKEATATTAEWLSGLTIGGGEAKIITVNANDSVLSVLAVLSSEDVQSCPVRDGDKLVGSIDMLDVVHHIADYLSDIQGLEESAFDALNINPHEIVPLKAKVKDVMGCSGCNPWQTLSIGDPLSKALSFLGDMKMHRVYITDEASFEPRGVIAQSQLLQWVAQHINELGPNMKKSITELGIVEEGSSVVTVTESTPAVDAFRAMVKNRVSSVGIVNSQNKLTNVISVRDVKILLRSSVLDVRLLFQDVISYIAMCRQLELQEKAPRITVKPDATLGKVIGLLAATRIHRVFVVDKTDHAIGVVALRDIIRNLMVD